jgi:hypothetical protein
VLVRCWAGCDVAEVVPAAGLDLGDLFPPRIDDRQRRPRECRPAFRRRMRFGRSLWPSNHAIGVASMVTAFPSLRNAAPGAKLVKSRWQATIVYPLIAEYLDLALPLSPTGDIEVALHSSESRNDGRLESTHAARGSQGRTAALGT